ncbi:hypothetical protein [Sporosarcina newyorkensis]|uniref:hypothetical protein n=1 Tax=Sporosarcina newyorkensis TaxID=759851 RepID=UPI003D07B10F
MKHKPTSADYSAAKANGISATAFYHRLRRGWDIGKAITEPLQIQERSKRHRVFALYKGDELLSVGTIEEIAEELNVLPETVLFYGTNVYKRRLETRKNPKNCRELVELEDDD